MVTTTPRAQQRTCLAAVGWLMLGISAPPAWGQACVNWTPRSSSPSARSYAAMAYDGNRHATVLFGGIGGGGLNDTWEWNGASWTLANPAASPAARADHAMAYDGARGVTVLFGGIAAGFLADTWEWNGVNWTQRNPILSPTARGAHAMAYDIARGVTVLFGGAGNGGVQFADTWEWNGVAWTLRTPADSPPVRHDAAMAYDIARGVTVLFGGAGAGGCLGDTWEWNGLDWAQRNPATSPPVRYMHTMVYDIARGVTVLFGGDCNGSRLGDTWEWNGTDWTQRSPAASPSPRGAHAMAYDGARAESVLFGGNNVGVDSGETWAFAYAAAPTILQQPTSQSVCSGGSVVLPAAAAGTGGLNYRWRRGGADLANGGNIAGADTPTLTINPAGEADAGPDYSLVVSDACGGSVVSANAAITVAVPPNSPCTTPAACGVCGAGSEVLLLVAVLGCCLVRRRSGGMGVKRARGGRSPECGAEAAKRCDRGEN
ncbi:MAG TPA: immunoglobulin domain-containing protein [Phycisphaerae bacterium]|nr:immunoglobulin domain-containing protein [Phycisphaerae bacterium]